MKRPKPLDYKCLRQKLNLSQLDFVTTEKLKILNEFIGQERALEALSFGIGIKSQGYNLYAMGPPGIGKHSFIKMMLEKHAAEMKTPPDWCYIHNFEAPEKPVAIRLPAGQGLTFQQDMKSLVDEMLSNILSIFESDEYQLGMKKINDYYKVKRVKFRKKNKKNMTTGKVLYLFKERNQKEKTLQSTLLSSVIKPLIRKLKKKYNEYTIVTDYLSAVEADVLQHADELIKPDEKTNLLAFSLENPALTKYKVNLLVDNSKLKGAPVIFEENPVYSNLISRVEHLTHLGTFVTNFTLIRPSSLQIANGGYLIIEARKLKKNRDAWEALKSALYTRKIKIEPVQQMSDLVKPVSLEPEPIPLDIKVILLGDRNTYYSLTQNDPDFTQLFKVPVDFDEEIDRNKKNIQLYARLIATIIQRDKLRPFHSSAVAAIIDHSTRLAQDIEKLSTHIRDIEDLILEADYWADLARNKNVKASDVGRALAAQIHRMDRARELYYEDITRDFIIINTEGKLIGQVNCLSVRRVGNFSYGHPTRVTARVRQGKGTFIDIQREIKMAGPLHSKAGLIIASFLASRFNPDQLYSLSASIAFEQLYCWTDGDSASVGELCALLSSLSELPLHQDLAITGSIDQYGEVQAVGGVNEKIEGFFDVCKAKGLTGKQGVLIPAVNKENLMLKDEIVEAVKAKKFAIYPITSIDEAISLLTGMTTGQRNDQGRYTKNSIYYRIENRLKLFTKNSQRIIKKKK